LIPDYQYNSSLFAVKDRISLQDFPGAFFSLPTTAQVGPQMNSGLTDTETLIPFMKGHNSVCWNANGIFLSTNNGAAGRRPHGVTNTSISALACSFESLCADNAFNYPPQRQLAAGSGFRYIVEYVCRRFGDVRHEFFAGMGYQSGILRSTNNGTSWTLLDSGVTIFLSLVLPYPVRTSSRKRTIC